MKYGKFKSYSIYTCHCLENFDKAENAELIMFSTGHPQNHLTSQTWGFVKNISAGMNWPLSIYISLSGWVNCLIVLLVSFELY